jgi:GT2 family glycosyltransferase
MPQQDLLLQSRQDAIETPVERDAPTDRRARLRGVIGIASAGRPTVLTETVRDLQSQGGPALEIIVCVPGVEHAGDLPQHSHLQVIYGPNGLTRQRNAILEAARGRADILVFFDDDFVPHRDYVNNILTAFEDLPNLVIATGTVVADGILGHPIERAAALARLSSCEAPAQHAAPCYNAYGCNMAVRIETARASDIWFDESLPLYGWLEDVDFSRAMARHGDCMRLSDAIGIHLGVRSGRQPGKRLGYSQVANPWFMMRKKTLTRPRGLIQITSNLLANIVGCAVKQADIDRAGRLHGNLLALADLISGKVDPRRILTLDQKVKTWPAAKPTTTEGPRG